MQKEILSPFFLQQVDSTNIPVKNFSQITNAAESLQLTMKPYLMSGSSISSIKPLMVFTGTDLEYSVED